MKEIKQNIEINKTNKFVFRDPVFSINRKYTVELCQEIIKENLNIEFLIETHLKNLDDELILLLKKAGLKLVYVGIESSSPDVLKGVKRFTIDNDQQHQKIKETIDYSLSLPNQLVQYSVFTPYPGTPIYKMYEDKIIEKKYEKFNQYNLVYKHKNLENSDIIKLKNYGYQKFYSNFKNLKTVLKSFSSLLR